MFLKYLREYNQWLLNLTMYKDLPNKVQFIIKEVYWPFKKLLKDGIEVKELELNLDGNNISQLLYHMLLEIVLLKLPILISLYIQIKELL